MASGNCKSRRFGRKLRGRAAVSGHRLVESEVTNCEFIAGDAYDITKLAGPADFGFLANAFHGVPDRARLATAVGAALKSNGQFAIQLA